jgi:hypothetical protein
MTIGAADLTGGDQFVEGESGLVALAVAEPADPRGQPLEGHALLRLGDPTAQCVVLGEEVEHGLVGTRDVLRGSPDSAAHRKGPLPSQKSGRRYSGTKPGNSEGPFEAAELGLAADRVAVVEDLGARSWKPTIASTCFAMDCAARSVNSSGFFSA